jgi:hypothetical protein
MQRLGLCSHRRRFDQDTIISQLTEAERGYLAGLLDGEGNISFAKERRAGVMTNRCRIWISIGNTNREVVDWLHKKIPAGNVCTDHRLNRFGKMKMHRWMVSTNPAIVLINEILPYLIIKRPIAELLKAGYKHLDAAGRHDLWLRTAQRPRRFA